MFDSTIGRWQTKDPKSFDAGDTNLYRFVGNHSSYATDPSGLEEPYVGPSVEILNKHKDAGGLNYEIRRVSRSELVDLMRAGTVSEHVFREAQDFLPMNGRVRIAVHQRLRKGINSMELQARASGILEAATAVPEVIVGAFATPEAPPAGLLLIAHGGDHLQAGAWSAWTGIKHDTYVSQSAQYVGVHALELSDEGAKALGRITEFGTDIAAPTAASRMIYLRGLTQSTSYASNFDSTNDYVYLSVFDGKTTHGVLLTDEGALITLQSGTKYPEFSNYPSSGHVEGKGAWFMREQNSIGGTLLHNNTDGTCGICNTNIPTLLPEGSERYVVPPKRATPGNSKSIAGPSFSLATTKARNRRTRNR